MEIIGTICYDSPLGKSGHMLVICHMELNELLIRTTLDGVVLRETKLKNERGTPDIGDDEYDLWMKSRSNKGGGRVIILTKKMC